MLNSSTEVLYYTELDTKIGPITVASTKRGICWLNIGCNEKTINQLRIWVKKWTNIEQILEAHNKLDDIKVQLIEYFDRKRTQFDLDLDLYGTSFQKLVWKSLLTIPYGEVRSYKEIAKLINMPKSVRAVGGANHNNPISIIVPCHRVIGSNGNLVGYGGGLEIKHFLLELEGYRA